jgi:adenylate cyclase
LTGEKVVRRLAAILAADVVGYSRLMGRDENGTLARLKAHRMERLEPAVARHGGRLVKLTGDGALVEFASAVNALSAAIQFQQAMADAHDRDQPEDARIVFRIGLHLGDLIVEDDDLYGEGVNIAARLEAAAPPGGIVISRTVHEAVDGRLKATFDDLGSLALRNIERSVQAFSVKWEPGDWQVHAPSVAVVSATVAPSSTADMSLAFPDKPSIAVLAFTNMSGDVEQEYFADGMVEDIITALSRFKEFFVIARNSSFVFKGRAIDVQQVARELGVRYVLEGSIRKATGRVRITCQLIDAVTRAHLWANRFDGTIDDVFDLQDRITESVVGALAPTLQRAEIERSMRKATPNLDAYDYVLRAQPLVIANAAAEAAEALRLLDKAFALSPDFARAHAFASMAWGQIFRSAPGPQREEARTKAAGHARRAVEQAGEDAAALAYAGFMLLITARDVAGARDALDKAVELNPNNAAAYGYRALVRAMSGAAQAAIEDAGRALRLSPLDPGGYQPQMAMAIAHLDLGAHAEAADWARKAIRSAPPRYPMSYAWLIVAECARGNTAEAERQVARLTEIMPGFTPPMLADLFDIFPEPLRSNSLSTLRKAGLLPTT